jgi:hypothetical protein
MADNVIIDQINWNSDLPKWATESTQTQIAKQLGANLKELKKQGNDDKKKGKTEAKANKDTTTILEKGFKSMRQAAGKQTEAFNKFSANKLIPKTPFKAFNTGIAKFAGKLGIAGAALGAFGFVVGGIVGRFKSFSDQFRTLFATGFRFDQGSIGLAKAAVRAEMSLDQYTEILGRYSTTVGVLGTRAFSDLNVAMRDNLAEIGLLGMNLGELTEYTADYLDQRRLLGILEESDRQALATNTETYLKNISALSTLLNVSRDQISQIIKSSVTVAAFTNALNQAPAALREQMLQTAQVVTGGFAALGNDYGNTLANAFTTAVGRGGLYFTEVGRELLAVSQPLYHAMSDLTNTIGPNEAGAKFSAMLDIIKDTSDFERERLMILERSNTQYAQGARNMIGLINQAQQLEDEQIAAIKNMEKMRDAQKPDDTTRAFTNLEIASQKIKLVFDKFFVNLFGNNKVLDLFENIMVKATSAVLRFSDYILQNAGKIGDAVGNMVARLLRWIEGFEGIGFGASIARALSGVFGLMSDMIVGAITKGFKLAMPGYLGGDGDLKTAEKNRVGSIDNAQSLATQRTGNSYSDAGALNQKALTSAVNNAKMAYKDANAKFSVTTDDYKIFADGAGPELTKILKNMVEDTYGLTGGFSNSGAQFLENVLTSGNQQLINQVFGRLEEISNQNVKVQQAIINDRAGTKINSSDFASAIPDNNGATLTDNMDGGKIADAKMRIMRQYLPMTGQGDPNQDPTKNYYERMIMELQQANTLLQKSITEAKSNTDKITQ